MQDLLEKLRPEGYTPPKRTRRKHARDHFLPYDPKLGDETFFTSPVVTRQWRMQPGRVGSTRQDGLSALPAPKLKRGATTAGAADLQQIRHLLARAAFGGSVADIAALTNMGRNQLVDQLLTDQPLPEPPDEWYDEPFNIFDFQALTPEEQMTFFQMNAERIYALLIWWQELMMSSPFTLREKMTFFWHGHFTTDIESAILAQLLFIQNSTVRQHALGNFGDFLKAIYKDPAMLLYLDGNSNVAANPNENFARELLELFTIGIGNYTEDDIKNAARAFSGWQLNPFNALQSFFNLGQHDQGTKTFLGESGNFDGDDIIDIILQQDVTSHFICGKLYDFFVSRIRDDTFVEQMATVFRDNDYEIKPVLDFMFKSDHFYQVDVVASLIKSPVELAVSNARIFSSTDVDGLFLLGAESLIGQELLNPPNVAGWPGQRAWINPTTYVIRNTFSEIYVNPDLFRDQDTGIAPIEFDVMNFAHSFGIATARELSDAMIDHLVRFPVSQETRDFLLRALIGSASPEDWSLSYPGVDKLITEFLTQIVRLPEFHLI